MNDKIKKILYELAKKSFLKNSIPISSVIIDNNNNIISKGLNKRQKTNNIFDHAEIIALKKAGKKYNNWKLDDLTLITTFEPCMMCTGAIIQSGIQNVIFMYDEPKFGFLNSNPTFDLSKINIKKIEPNNQDFDHIKLIRDFFVNLRTNKLNMKLTKDRY